MSSKLVLVLNCGSSSLKFAIIESVCISINEVVCHGIPDDAKLLKDGDIVNIDVTVIKDGFHGDTSKMFIVGKPTIMGERLCRITQESLYLALLFQA